MRAWIDDRVGFLDIANVFESGSHGNDEVASWKRRVLPFTA